MNQPSRSARRIVEAMEFYLQRTGGAANVTITELVRTAGGEAICNKARLFAERGFESLDLRQSLASLIALPKLELTGQAAEEIERERDRIRAQVISSWRDCDVSFTEGELERMVEDAMGRQKHAYVRRRHDLLLAQLQSAMTAQGWQGRTTLTQLADRLDSACPLDEGDKDTIVALGAQSNLTKRFRKTGWGPAPFQHLVRSTVPIWTAYTGRAASVDKHDIDKIGTLYDLLCQLGRANRCWEGRPESFNQIVKVAEGQQPVP